MLLLAEVKGGNVTIWDDLNCTGYSCGQLHLNFTAHGTSGSLALAQCVDDKKGLRLESCKEGKATSLQACFCCCGADCHLITSQVEPATQCHMMVRLWRTQHSHHLQDTASLNHVKYCYKGMQAVIGLRTLFTRMNKDDGDVTQTSSLQQDRMYRFAKYTDCT